MQIIKAEITTFHLLMKEYLFFSKELVFEDLGMLKMVRNAAIPNKTSFLPPSFSLIWNDKTEMSSLEISEKWAKQLDYFVKKRGKSKLKVHHFLETHIANYKTSLERQSFFNIEGIGEVHTTQMKIFYVIAHEKIFPNYPRLQRNHIYIPQTTPTSSISHSPSLDTSTITSSVQKTVQPTEKKAEQSYIAHPTKNSPLNSTSVYAEKNKTVSPRIENAPKNKIENPLVRYIFILVFILCVVIILFYFFLKNNHSGFLGNVVS